MLINVPCLYVYAHLRKLETWKWANRVALFPNYINRNCHNQKTRFNLTYIEI